MKFTQGKWTVSTKGNPGHSVDIYVDYERDVICSCEPFYGQEEANAHLIAAAPALYEACKEAMKWFDRHGEGPQMTSTDLFIMLEAALSQAEGKE